MLLKVVFDFIFPSLSLIRDWPLPPIIRRKNRRYVVHILVILGYTFIICRNFLSFDKLNFRHNYYCNAYASLSNYDFLGVLEIHCYNCIYNLAHVIIYIQYWSHLSENEEGLEFCFYVRNWFSIWKSILLIWKVFSIGVENSCMYFVHFCVIYFTLSIKMSKLDLQREGF